MKRIQIVARIPAALRRDMAAVAKRDGVTLNTLVQAAITRHVARRRHPRAPIVGAPVNLETK